MSNNIQTASFHHNQNKKSDRYDNKFSLSIKQATDYFGIGEKKIRNMATYLDGIFVKNGNKILVIREKFEAYLQSIMPK